VGERHGDGVAGLPDAGLQRPPDRPGLGPAQRIGTACGSFAELFTRPGNTPEERAGVLERIRAVEAFQQENLVVVRRRSWAFGGAARQRMS
jgi:hypothetical protein